MMADWRQLADSGLDFGSECGMDDTESIDVGSELSGLEVVEWAAFCSLRSRVGVSAVQHVHDTYFRPRTYYSSPQQQNSRPL